MSKLANLNLIRWSFKIDKQIYGSPEGPYLAVAFFCCRFFFSHRFIFPLLFKWQQKDCGDNKIKQQQKN